ncbi:MAG: DEAD/DEAH box helicase [Chlamydiales bacterium]|nr:DEAD/DEAH box helicase [Chlamydiia bacterium]MCP5507101.1 DEAD/DEAH box helicase [Chlamydiales bacterium]
MSFDEFNLHPQLLKAIQEAGYSEPTEIQKKAIPQILEGGDIRASAQTGTGKTAAFLLPALNRLANADKVRVRGPRVLVLAPTRELAMQIAVQSEKYSKHLKSIRTICIGGGVPYFKHQKMLSRPYDVLIATPGRLLDYMKRKKIDLSHVELVVLDEADRMLDMGFVEPVEEIMGATPDERQTLLFTATMQESVARLSRRLLKNPTDIAIKAEKDSHTNITQQLLFADDLHHKNRLLNHILTQDDVEYTIIFTSTKRHADQLVNELCDQGHRAAALHGDMDQRRRTRTIAQLREGKVKVLVATDVAARGIDVQSITHVINFDLPNNVEDYVHRIGRTGRAGAKGTALSFVGGRDREMAKRIERFTGQQIAVVEIAGLKPRWTERPSGGPKRRMANKKKPFQRSRRNKPGYAKI